MTGEIPWKDGTKIWCVYRDYGGMMLHHTEDAARDDMRRKDQLFSFVVSQFRQEP